MHLLFGEYVWQISLVDFREHESIYDIFKGVSQTRQGNIWLNILKLWNILSSKKRFHYSINIIHPQT